MINVKTKFKRTFVLFYFLLHTFYAIFFKRKTCSNWKQCGNFCFFFILRNIFYTIQIHDNNRKKTTEKKWQIQVKNILKKITNSFHMVWRANIRLELTYYQCGESATELQSFDQWWNLWWIWMILRLSEIFGNFHRFFMNWTLRQKC
jgi:hypothetical protein